MIKTAFPDGGFVLHKIDISGSLCDFLAWYSAAGKLLDSERIDRLGRSYPATPNQQKHLAALGPIWSN